MNKGSQRLPLLFLRVKLPAHCQPYRRLEKPFTICGSVI